MYLSLRSLRISNEIYKILSALLRDTVSNYWLLHAVITDVDVSRNLKYANIFFYSVDIKLNRNNILDAFHHSIGFFRKHLAKRLSLHTIPKLNFLYDTSIDYGTKIEDLMGNFHSIR
jgi:ribosome-binding factor A